MNFSRVRDGFSRFFEKNGPWSANKTNLATGLHHYKVEGDHEKSRVHLRLDPDGHGTLIINANRVIHLNPTGAIMAYLILEKKREDEAIKILRKLYHVSFEQAKEDLAGIRDQISELTRPDGACPIHDLELETIAPFSARPTAPYRMDLAITYRCNNNCSHCYNARERTFPELSTEDWFRVLDDLWALGIPHVVFTGGEPTLREDLPLLISHAEANGQITGLNTNGRRISDSVYLNKLVDAGLDHVQITVESSDEQIHNSMVQARAYEQTITGLRNALKSSLYVMTNTTMLQDNVHNIPTTLDFLAELGVPTIGLNALIHSGKGKSVGTGLPELDLLPLLEIAKQKTEKAGQRLIWYTPTQYCGFDPQALDLGVKGCTAALYNMCIEPNGDVLPCQSYYQPVGNMLKNDWSSIWNADLSVSLRERKKIPSKCNSCELLSECGGGCPLQFATQ